MLNVTLVLPQVRAERFQHAINHAVKWKDVGLYYPINNITYRIIVTNSEGTPSDEPVSESDFGGISPLYASYDTLLTNVVYVTLTL